MERKTKQNLQQEALRSWQPESLLGPNEAAKTVAVPGFVAFLCCSQPLRIICFSDLNPKVGQLLHLPSLYGKEIALLWLSGVIFECFPRLVLGTALLLASHSPWHCALLAPPASEGLESLSSLPSSGCLPEM